MTIAIIKSEKDVDDIVREYPQFKKDPLMSYKRSYDQFAFNLDDGMIVAVINNGDLEISCSIDNICGREMLPHSEILPIIKDVRTLNVSINDAHKAILDHIIRFGDHIATRPYGHLVTNKMVDIYHRFANPNHKAGK